MARLLGMPNTVPSLPNLAGTMIWTLTSKSITKHNHSNWSHGVGRGGVEGWFCLTPSLPRSLLLYFRMFFFLKQMPQERRRKNSKYGLRATRVILEIWRNVIWAGDITWFYGRKKKGSRRRRKQPAVGITSSRGRSPHSGLDTELVNFCSCWELKRQNRNPERILVEALSGQINFLF